MLLFMTLIPHSQGGHSDLPTLVAEAAPAHVGHLGKFVLKKISIQNAGYLSLKVIWQCCCEGVPSEAQGLFRDLAVEFRAFVCSLAVLLCVLGTTVGP